MRAFGVLRSLVELQTPTRVSNGAGGFTTSYAVSAAVHGEIVAALRETVERTEGGAPSVPAYQEYALELGDAALDETTRLAADGRSYEIVSIARQDTFAFGRCREVT